MKAEGVIKSVRKDGKGFCIGDTWYSVFKPEMLKAQKGDTVSFEYTEKGDYKNVKGDVQKIGGSSGNSSSNGAGSAVPAGRGGNAFDIGVQVGHALNCAVHLAGPKAKIEDVEKLAVQVYKLSAKMKAEAAAGKYDTKPVADAEDPNDDVPF